TLDNALKRWWPINIHLIGKDILRFHAVYWPAMQMSAGVPVSGQVFGHGFLTKDGQKMGKSLGNTLDPVDLVTRYGADAVRYYFLRAIEFGKDGDFSEIRFVDVLNADLAKNMGNLLNRTLKMAKKYCDGKVPDIDVGAIAADHPLKSKGIDLAQQVSLAYSRLSFSHVCELVLSLTRASNKLIDDQAPWALFKEGKQADVDQLIYSVLESTRLAAYLLSPIIPGISNAVYQQLGYTLDFNQAEAEAIAPFPLHTVWSCLPPKQTLGEPQPIFQQLATPELSTPS
ncbi:MAG TPA: methionine--tRNA ligase, partial [Candidatus Obscuribacterales bacterium]